MADLVGQLLGKYRLIHRLGIGGVAQVYLGENIIVPQMIQAIKVLSPVSADGAAAFEQEARTLRRLTHPHILKILDFGISAEGIPYLVMPYQSNGNVRQEYPSGLELSLATVVGMIKQVANALTYAHTRARPIIHGNIKPSNILLGPSYDLLLSDFGTIMRLPQEAPTQALLQSSVSCAYVAPEQLLSPGKPEYLSAATDQYALGVLAYDLLTGEWPFHGEVQVMRHQKIHDAPSALRAKRPDISPEVEQVIV